MNFLINRDLLLSNLNDVSKALSNKPQMPTATGIKLEAKKNELTIVATNSEVAIRAIIPVSSLLSIEEEGVILLPGKFLLETVRRSEADNLNFVIFEKNVVKIIAGRSEITMNTMDCEAFPMVSFDENGTNIELDVLNIKQMIKQTAFAAGSLDEQLVLTGVNMFTDGTKLEVVATDRYRLAKKHLIFPQELVQFNVIFPAKSLEDLNKIIVDPEERVQISISSTKAIFKYKNITFRTRLIKGAFPNTSSLIPHEFITQIKFNKQELLATIDRVSLFVAQESTSTVKLALTKSAEVEISSISNEIGAVQEVLKPVSCTELVPFQTAFDYKFLVDAIKALDSNEITISFTGEIKPFVLTGEYDINYIQLIVPKRV